AITGPASLRILTSPPRRCLVPRQHGCQGGERTTIKLVGEAGTRVADRHPAGAIAGIGPGVNEARSPEVGVAVFESPDYIVREGVIQPDTGGPTRGDAAMGEERWSPISAAYRENRRSPAAAAQAERPAAAVRDRQSSSAAPPAAPRLNSASREPPAAGQPLRCPSSSGRHWQPVRCSGESSLK